MRVIRSFPEVIPPGRAYVTDGLERHVMAGYDYSGLKRYGEDLVLVEWDIAVSPRDLARFAAESAGSDWPRVAPYEIGDPPHCAHWIETSAGLRPVSPPEPHCDLFGFGLAYLPGWVIRDCPARYESSSIMGDGTLPRWLRTLPGWRPVPVDWTITVVHLH